MSMDQVAPCLLVASPLLLDLNFLHTVVLIIEHTESGAMGIVLNRPISATVAQICAEGGMDYNGDPNATAFRGGPVDPHKGILLVRGEIPSQADTVLNFTDFVSVRKDLLESLAKKPDSRFKLFLGYSGWSAGQLENELEMRAWIRVSLSPDLLFMDEPLQLWGETMKALLEQA